ncbi:MAG: PD40 domain-containing protein, partial [Anaerolineae bacterium]|nr:PD40 domain-containing protein [Anaerolineae bacterium]
MTTPHRPITPKDVVDYRAPRDAQISPDGQFVAFSLEHASKPRPMSQLPSQIWLAEVASAHSRRLTFSAGVDCSPRWSPDSRRLAFLSDRARSDQFQLHVLELSGGEARPVT